MLLCHTAQLSTYDGTAMWYPWPFPDSLLTPCQGTTDCMGGKEGSLLTGEIPHGGIAMDRGVNVGDKRIKVEPPTSCL